MRPIRYERGLVILFLSSYVQWQVDINMNGSQMVNTDGSCSESYKSAPDCCDNSTHVSVNTERHCIAQQLKENKVNGIVSHFAFNRLFYVVLWYCTIHRSDSESIGSGATTTTTDIAFPS